MSYTISLDAIDFHYLPITNYARNNKVKLFDISSAKRRDYIEFEIFASKKNDDSNNETIPPHPTTICQICDKSIPTCYIIEHNQSSKHKMYKSIMDNALERAKKYLNDENTVPDTKKLPNSYFCGVCCLPLLNSEKETHEKSQKHCDELKKEKLLKDFLCLYSLHVLPAEDNERLIVTADSECISSIKDIGGSDDANNVFTLSESEVKTANQSIAEPVVNINVPQRAEKRKRQIESKSVVSDETLVEPKKIKSEVIEQNIPAEIAENAGILFNEDILELTLTDGTIINVFEHKNNGFISVTDDITICLLCNELVSNTLAHKESPKHLEKIVVPVDANCIRQIENNFNHCVLCNEIFPDVINHMDSNNLHVSSKMASHSRFTMTCHENSKTVSEVNKNFPDYHHLEIQEQSLNCKVCNQKVINSVDIARTHVGSISHVAMYKELLKSNRLTQVDDNYFECNFCNDRAILKRTELLHIIKDDHKFSSANHITTEQDFQFDKDIKIEYPENTKLLKVEPIVTDPPKVNVSAKPNPKLSADELPNSICSTLVLNTLRCTVCEVNLLNSKLNVEQHIKSKKHKTKYMKSLRKVINKPYVDFTELFIESTKNRKRVICTICEITFSSTAYYIRAHLKGFGHVDALASFLKFNHIRESTEPNKYSCYCEACKTGVEIATLKQHVHSPYHKAFVNKYNKALKYYQVEDNNQYFCYLCDVYVGSSVRNMVAHENGDLHRANLIIKGYFSVYGQI